MKLNSSKAPSGFPPPYVGSNMFGNVNERFSLFKL